MIETVQQLLRSRMDDDTVAMAHGDRSWTWREHLAEAAAEASALIARADPSRPVHVGALLGNSPAMLRSMAAAALGGYVLCGINTTRRGDGLAADIRRADCQLVLADAEHMPLLDGLDLGRRDRPRRRRACLPGRGGRGRTACATSGSDRRRPRRHALHVGHQRRPEGRAVRPRDGGHVRREPGRTVRPHGRRRLLPVDAAVPLQRRGGRLGGRHRMRGDDGAREILAVAVPVGHPPVRRHVHELRRQAAGAGAGHARETRRCRQHAAGGVRQRGHRARRRRVRASFRMQGGGQLRIERVRRRRDARGRLPAGIDRQGISGCERVPRARP